MKKFLGSAIALGLASPAIATDFTVVGQSNGVSFSYAKIEWSYRAGSTEQGVIKFACTGGAVTSAWLHAPRDVATGQSSGKRTHHPVTFVKEWGPAAPSLSSAKASWDLAKAKGARTASGGKTMAVDDWHEISVRGMDAACPSTSSATGMGSGKASVSDISITK